MFTVFFYIVNLSAYRYNYQRVSIASMGLSSFNFFVMGSERHVCNATKRIIAVQGQFRVIQGR